MQSEISKPTLEILWLQDPFKSRTSVSSSPTLSSDSFVNNGLRVQGGSELMALRKCKVIAIEGTYGSGKTILALSLCSHLKRRNLHSALVHDVARESGYILEALLGAQAISIESELHLFGTQIAAELQYAQLADYLVCDRTIINVLAYSEVFLRDSGAQSFSKELLEAMWEFSRHYVQIYDFIFKTAHLYDPGETPDPFRPKDKDIQLHADTAFTRVMDELGVKYYRLPATSDMNTLIDFILETTGIE